MLLILVSYDANGCRCRRFPVRTVRSWRRRGRFEWRWSSAFSVWRASDDPSRKCTTPSRSLNEISQVLTNTSSQYMSLVNSRRHWAIMWCFRTSNQVSALVHGEGWRDHATEGAGAHTGSGNQTNAQRRTATRSAAADGHSKLRGATLLCHTPSSLIHCQCFTDRYFWHVIIIYSICGSFSLFYWLHNSVIILLASTFSVQTTLLVWTIILFRYDCI